MPNSYSELQIAKAGQSWPSLAFDLWQDEMLFPALIDANPCLAETIIFEGGEPVFIPDVSDSTINKSNLPPWRQ